MKYADRFRDWLLRPITDRLDEPKRAAQARAAEAEAQERHRRSFSHGYTPGWAPLVVTDRAGDPTATARATMLAVRMT